MDADLPAPDRVDLDPMAADAGTLDATPVMADADGAEAGPAPTGATANPSDPPAVATAAGLDLEAIAADLEAVQVALQRLGDGTYWTDEMTGEPLTDDLLAASPTARRA